MSTLIVRSRGIGLAAAPSSRTAGRGGGLPLGPAGIRMTQRTRVRAGIFTEFRGGIGEVIDGEIV